MHISTYGFLSHVHQIFIRKAVIFPLFWSSALIAEPVLLGAKEPIEEVIISASRQSLIDFRGDTGKSVIHREELERAQIGQVKDALDSLQGVETAQAGAGQGFTGVFLRGAKSEHTLILVDGVDVSNPALLARTYDVALLGASEVERIEVLRGPQSVLYGSSAMGGVINIVTRRPQKPLEVSASVSGGAHNTMTQKLHVGARRENGFYASLGGRHSETEGISATNFDKKPSLEQDGQTSTEALVRFGYEKHGEHVGFMHRHVQLHTDLDQSFGTVWDDPNYTTASRDDLTSIVYEKTWSPYWRTRFLLARDVTSLNYNDQPDDLHPTDALQATYKGERNKWEAQATWQAHERWALTWGVDGRDDRASSKATSSSSFGTYTEDLPNQRDHGTGVFAQQEWQITDAWVLVAGLRQDEFKDHDAVNTYRAFTRYTLPSNTHFSASTGTGFNAPSLYQRYSNFGDPQLKAEESQSWDVGVEQDFGSQLKASLTYFKNRFENMIDFGATRYENVAKAESFGTESTLEGRWQEFLAGVTYTQMTARNIETKQILARRAKDRFTWRLAYQTQRASLQLDGRTVGRRFDAGQWLEKYSVLGLGATMAVADQWSVFTRIDNLTDQAYTDVYGFNTLPRSAYFGGSFVL